MYSAIELQRYELVHIPAKFLLIFFLWFLEISPSPVAGKPAGCLSGDGWQKQPDGRKCQNFLECFGDFVIRWFSSGLGCGQTEAALRNFETPFLRDEVPLVNAETGRLSAVCQIFLECGNPPTEEKGPVFCRYRQESVTMCLVCSKKHADKTVRILGFTRVGLCFRRVHKKSFFADFKNNS